MRESIDGESVDGRRERADRDGSSGHSRGEREERASMRGGDDGGRHTHARVGEDAIIEERPRREQLSIGCRGNFSVLRRVVVVGVNEETDERGSWIVQFDAVLSHT